MRQTAENTHKKCGRCGDFIPGISRRSDSEDRALIVSAKNAPHNAISLQLAELLHRGFCGGSHHSGQSEFLLGSIDSISLPIVFGLILDLRPENSSFANPAIWEKNFAPLNRCVDGARSTVDRLINRIRSSDEPHTNHPTVRRSGSDSDHPGKRMPAKTMLSASHETRKPTSRFSSKQAGSEF